MQPRRDKNANAQGWNAGMNRGQQGQGQHEREWSSQDRFFGNEQNETRQNEYRGEPMRGEYMRGEGEWRGSEYGPYGGQEFGGPFGGQRMGGQYGGGQYGGNQYGGGQYGGNQYGSGPYGGGQYGFGQGGQYGFGQYGIGALGEGIPRLFGRGPKGYTRPDERIREDVCDRLMMMTDLDSTDVEVVVVSGEVTLTGTVPERSMKYRVEHVADQVGGVKEINNQLKIKRDRELESSPVSGADQPDRKRSRS